MRDADTASMHDEPTSDTRDADGQGHPLERAHRFFQRTAPVIREAAEAIERHGGIDQVRETVVERATELVQRADDAIANASAIEGVVVERTADEAVAPVDIAAARRRARRRLHHLELALLAFAATFGALALQRRTRR